MKYGVMTDTPSTPSRSAIFVSRTDLARRLRPGAGEDRHALVDVSHRRGDDFLLFALVERVELAVGAEHEDAVNAVGDEVVEEPAAGAAGRGPRWPASAWRRGG